MSSNFSGLHEVFLNGRHLQDPGLFMEILAELSNIRLWLSSCILRFANYPGSKKSRLYENFMFLALYGSQKGNVDRWWRCCRWKMFTTKARSFGHNFDRRTKLYFRRNF